MLLVPTVPEEQLTSWLYLIQLIAILYTSPLEALTEIVFSYGKSSWSSFKYHLRIRRTGEKSKNQHQNNREWYQSFHNISSLLMWLKVFEKAHKLTSGWCAVRTPLYACFDFASPHWLWRPQTAWLCNIDHSNRPLLLFFTLILTYLEKTYN